MICTGQTFRYPAKRIDREQNIHPHTSSADRDGFDRLNFIPERDHLGPD